MQQRTIITMENLKLWAKLELQLHAVPGYRYEYVPCFCSTYE